MMTNHSPISLGPYALYSICSSQVEQGGRVLIRKNEDVMCDFTSTRWPSGMPSSSLDLSRL